MRAKIDAQRGEHDIKVAERRAQWAEEYAMDVTDFAYDAIADAEAAILQGN